MLRRLLAQARRAGVRPGLLLLDREFYAADVVRHLQAARTPFLMPAEVRGRKADHPLGPSSTRAFALRKRGGWFEHTIRGATKRARVAICVACFNDRVPGLLERHAHLLTNRRGVVNYQYLLHRCISP